MRHRVYIGHVRNRSHFVLLTAAAGPAAFAVLDPYFNATEYPAAEISDVIEYAVIKHTEPVAYPRFDQCDPRWGQAVMGGNGKTVCQVGCLLSSISSALAGAGVPIAAMTANPGLLNLYLRSHRGYPDANSSALDEAAVATVSPRVRWPSDGMHTTADLSYSTIREYLFAPEPRVVIANVLHGEHFVLVAGLDDRSNDTLFVRDSGFDRQTYSMSHDVVGWRLFDIAGRGR